MPRIVEFESTFKAALKLVARAMGGAAGRHRGPTSRRFKRGHRVELLQQAIAPLRGELTQGAVHAPRAGPVADLRRSKS